MQITEEIRESVLILVIEEKRLDAGKAPVLREEISKWIKEGHKQIVLDISTADFMDSSALSVLISSLKTLGPQGKMAIAGAHGPVERLFALTRMDRVFSLNATIDDAVAKLVG